MLDLRHRFQRFRAADPERLHFAAHSHHYWPDVTREAQLKAWDDACTHADDKWEVALGPVLDEARGHVARHLNLPDPASLIFAPNTHEFLKRILSCFPAGKSVRVLATDGEFHTFTRQMARYEEDGVVTVERVPVEPVESFEDRFIARAGEGGFDLVWTSQVFFNSGFAVTRLEDIAQAAGDAMLVFDGYHGFLARPTDLSRVAHRAFYMSGGYKYAMAGEGCCFLHCPPGWGARPRDTGWYAAFGVLSSVKPGEVPYAQDGWRFMGATFDVSGLYRLNAAMRMLAEEGVDAAKVHAHALALQQRFAAALPLGPLSAAQLVLPMQETRRGNFLTFDLDDAGGWQKRLHEKGIITDSRGRRLRFGFGLEHAAEDVDALIARMRAM